MRTEGNFAIPRLLQLGPNRTSDLFCSDSSEPIRTGGQRIRTIGLRNFQISNDRLWPDFEPNRVELVITLLDSLVGPHFKKLASTGLRSGVKQHQGNLMAFKASLAWELCSCMGGCIPWIVTERTLGFKCIHKSQGLKLGALLTPMGCSPF